ncbi:hypothetical protein [uncultured Eubacterium sp.]|uniref:hypothetical protein n=1 Tax=uncultured Eubacterium sp. TaxID=165185 RepID=UPI0025F0C3D5|nr:hypothetical protein [uncultured Eubacterium sp.]
MKTFSLRDCNKPIQFYANCTGCILLPKKMDQVVIVTANGEHVNVGIQLPHELSLKLYDKILETANIGGTIHIPDMQELNDDEIRVAIDELEIEFPS